MYKSEEQIQKGIKSMLRKWYNNSLLDDEEEIVYMPILTGGIIFAVDLIKYFGAGMHGEIYPVQCKTYTEAGHMQSTSVNWLGLDLFVLKNKTVFLMDDIWDSGQTIITLYKEIIKHNPKQVFAFTLFKRISALGPVAPIGLHHFWVFDIPEGLWLEGYGMDKYRALPYVKTV